MSGHGPETVVISDGALKELGTILSDYKRPLCVTDRQIHSEYGSHLEEMVGTSCKWVMGQDYGALDPAKFKDSDIILGFGGGSSLDVAKLIARETGLDWISIPTAASHDGIASEVASVSHDGYKYSKKCKGPLAVVADTSLISKAPPILRLSGIGDIICKTSSLAEWRLAHEASGEPFNPEIYKMVERALVSVIRDDSIGTLIRAEIDSGRAMSLFGSSRPCSGTEHAISHAMDRSTDGLHGLQVAFATPLCLYYLHDLGYSEYSPDHIREFMVDRSMPTTLAEMKSTEVMFLDDIEHALKIMERRGRYSVFRHLNLDKKQFSRTLRELGYI
ncbi:MAG: iron-containing alcohol dehydrogenase [Candidatus Thorarchaeota archaeon]